MLNINEIISHGTALIDQSFENGKFRLKMSVMDKVNMVNSIGRKLGVEQLSTDFPDAYDFLRRHLDLKLNQQVKNESTMTDVQLIEEALKFALNEAPKESIPTSKYINRYEDEDVVKIIKQIAKKDFKGFKLEKISDNNGFWSVDVSTSVDELNVDGDVEMKRFALAKVMAKFREEFFAAISKVLPIINIKTTPYQFTKNSSKVKFGLIMALSSTNDRDWVTGAYKRPDEKAAEKLVDAQTKEDKE